MDTSGHHELSAIGEKLLKPALKKSNSGKEMRIGAFYLGNWLTDVSQCIDPVAYKNAAEKVQELDRGIKVLFERLNFDTPSWIPVAITDVLTPVTKLRQSLVGAEQKLLEDLRKTLAAGEKGDLAKAFKEAFHFIGYSKFVLDDHYKPTRMDSGIYTNLFYNRFTQYFPHEHLDRPEIKPKIYETSKSDTPLNRWTKTKKGEKITGLYAFLREDIQLAAGLLSYLDAGNEKVKAHKSWAAGTFHKDRTEFTGRDGKSYKVDDADYEWNYHLAMLGHSLHAVEDFFAHSTFVEHASGVFPKDYKKFETLEEGTILKRRLTEWVPNFDDNTGDWLKLKQPDPYVVTGYYDTVDTIISLTHLLDHWFELPNEKIGRRADDVIEYEYTKLFTDTLGLISDFDVIWKDPKNDPKFHGYDAKDSNLAAAILHETVGKGLEGLKGESKVTKIVETLLVSKYFKNLPQPVKESFKKGVRLFIGGINLYKCLKSIYTFLKDPLAWLEQLVADAVKGLVKDVMQVYLKNLLLEYIGSQRIGCHSLIAKDSGPEIFHEAAMQCAKATHWYVVHCMTRHFRSSDQNVARSRPDGKDSNIIPLSGQIDWLELLEYFLEHPLTQVQQPSVTKDISIMIPHVTKQKPGTNMSSDSLQTLEDKYKATFLSVPGGPSEFTWELIADFNFPTAGLSYDDRVKTINRVLKYQDRGVKVADGVNYAFKPGLRLIIPYQKAEVPVYDTGSTYRPWWYPVIVGKKGYKSVANWFDAAGRLSPNAPKWAHHPYPITKDDANAFYREVLSKQNKLRAAYEGKALEELY